MVPRFGEGGESGGAVPSGPIRHFLRLTRRGSAGLNYFAPGALIREITQTVCGRWRVVVELRTIPDAGGILLLPAWPDDRPLSLRRRSRSRAPAPAPHFHLLRTSVARRRKGACSGILWCRAGGGELGLAGGRVGIDDRGWRLRLLGLRSGTYVLCGSGVRREFGGRGEGGRRRRRFRGGR